MILNGMTLKRWLVAAMERSCSLIDQIRPWQIVAYTPLRWLGCPRGLAAWSDRLDQHWGTEVWSKPEEKP
jgi:hypothetical protein